MNHLLIFPYFLSAPCHTPDMRACWSSALLPIAALLASAALAGAHARPEPNALAGPSSGDLGYVALFARDDEHSHVHSHNAPLEELNETIILQWHKPTPPSYGTHDFEDPDVTNKYPHLMALHVVFMSLAFFGALPIGACRRSSLRCDRILSNSTDFRVRHCTTFCEPRISRC